MSLCTCVTLIVKVWLCTGQPSQDKQRLWEFTRVCCILFLFSSTQAQTNIIKTAILQNIGHSFMPSFSLYFVFTILKDQVTLSKLDIVQNLHESLECVRSNYHVITASYSIGNSMKHQLQHAPDKLVLHTRFNS